MWPYWLMFLLPAYLAWQEVKKQTSTVPNTAAKWSASWSLVGVSVALLVGWRHEVGGDWGNYLRQFGAVGFDMYRAEWWKNDPGYRLLEWLAFNAGWGIHGVNLMAAAVFAFGLLRFCRELPRPWLALAVAVPYLVIILGMGYSRQGVALGCLMAGLVGLGRGQLVIFLVWTVLGATFHKSAVLLLPMAALASTQNRTWASIWVGLVVAVAYTLLLEDSVDALRSGYLEAEYESQGALVRLLMNALPATVLLVLYRRFALTLPQQHLWYWMAWASLGLLVLYFVSPSSTAVDRVGLYLLPLQLMVFAHLPEVLGHPGAANQGWVLAVLGYYATVQFVWLNFATHAFAWIPYRFYPLEVLL